MLLIEKNIREVTLFPMNQNTQDLMMKAPSQISDNQLAELNIAIKKNRLFFPLRFMRYDKSTSFFL